jgi:S-adenosylmethionine decarboxylase proenzyme
MEIKSEHLLVELFGCDREVLQSKVAVETLLVEAAVAANVTIVQSVFHRYSPQGVTGVVIIEESHLSIHTWPEYGYASVDFYTCGDGMPEKALEVIKAGLHASRTESIFVDRGQSLEKPAMSIRYHRNDNKIPA